MSGIRLLAALGVALVTGGCVSQQPLVLSSRYTPPASNGVLVPVRGQSVCQVRIGSLQDVRSEPATLGTVIGRPVHSPPDVREWLRQVVLGLNAPGLLSVSLDDASGAGQRVDVELVTAWVTELHTAKSASIVMRATYHRGEGSAAEAPKLYRGSSSSTDWNAGDGELQRMIDRALSGIVAQMRSDLLGSCHTAAGGAPAAR